MIMDVLSSVDLKNDYTVGYTSGQEFKTQNLDPKKFVGLTLDQIFGEKADIVKSHYKKTFNGEEQTFELFINNQYQYYRCVPLVGDDGTIPQILVVAENITSRRQLENRIQQSQKMDAIATLAGGIAHDFNNLLSVITGNVSYSLSQLKTDEELFDVLSEVQNGVRQAQTLTQQLLTFSKGGEPIKKTADINLLVKEATEFAVRGTNARCEYELSKNLLLCEVDAGQINQVISNLVINASQSMPKGGTIYIKTETIDIDDATGLPLYGGQYIKIAIQDQGTGISKKNIKNIFDPFFTTKTEGNGLGLSTVYSIIKKHNGHITVYSEIEKGTVFNIYIPSSHKKIEKSEDKFESTHQGHGKILVMDDQEPILKMVGRMLNRMGYEVVFAFDGSQTIEKYMDAKKSGNPFALVILDLTIPGRCGVIPKPYTKEQLSELLNIVFGRQTDCET